MTDKSAFRMAGRSLLKLGDLTDGELLQLLQLSADLKQRRADGIRGDLLARRHIALIFEKLSTRTRCAFTVAVSDEGGYAECLSRKDIHLGKKESVADTARVLGRMFDGIMFRGFAQQTVDTLALHGGVPVWNGLTDDFHPTQALADLLTIRERFGRLKGLKVAYVGDGRNNVATSLMIGCAKTGIDFVNVTPQALSPDAATVAWCRQRAVLNGGSIEVSHDPLTAVAGANAVYTDVWVSMGEEAQQEERVEMLMPFQVNAELMAATGNLDSGEVIFLHCLPAFHDRLTEMTAECGALEVTDEVFEADYSLVFDQAENRMHTIKAVMVASLA